MEPITRRYHIRIYTRHIKLKSIKGSPLLGIDYLTGDEATTTDKLKDGRPSTVRIINFTATWTISMLKPYGSVDSKCRFDGYISENQFQNE
jgi:hypothetical protein